tara:strand:+ start:86 stop:1027 length:942 start_codon:yes stop_codon:yes gene_type:complete
MAKGLVFSGDQYAAISDTSIPVIQSDIDIELDLRLDQLPSEASHILTGTEGNDLSKSYFAIKHLVNGDITVGVSQDGLTSTTFTPPAIGTRFTLKIEFRGMSTGSAADQGTYEVFVDGVSVDSTPKTVNSGIFINNTNYEVGGLKNVYEPVTYDDTQMTLVGLRIVSTGNYDYNWTADASDTTTTGVQPVLVDANGSAVTIDGNDFATDGSQWVDLGGGPTTEPFITGYTVLVSGSPQANLTGVKVRVVDGDQLNGTELYHSATETTDGSGVLNDINLSSTSASVGDTVTVSLLTPNSEGIVFTTTVDGIEVI